MDDICSCKRKFFATDVETRSTSSEVVLRDESALYVITVREVNKHQLPPVTCTNHKLCVASNI